MRPPARRCWWCTTSIPRRKRLTADRRARCRRRSTNSTSFSPAWDQVRRQNDAANPSNKRFRAAFSSAEDSFPFNDARYDCRVGAAEANDGLRTSQWNHHVLRSPRRWRTGGVASRRVHDRTAQLSQDPASGPYRLQHGRSRGDAVCDPPSGQSAKGSHHFVHVPQQRHGRGAFEAILKLTADDFKGSPIETEYKKLSPTPDYFPNFVQHIVTTASKSYDFGADKLKATTTPMFFIHGDADGVRLAHVAEMFRLKGGEAPGDMGPRCASRLAILPDTTHVTLMQRIPIIVPMVNDFLDAKP